MMMDYLTTFQEDRIQYRIMERLENENLLTGLPHGQSTLMTKCVAQQILGNWLEIFSWRSFLMMKFDIIGETINYDFK